MNAVDPRGAVDLGSPRRVQFEDGHIERLPYRRAVSLISRGLATWAKPPAKKRAPKKAAKADPEPTLSDAAPEGSIVDSAENEPAHNLL